MTRAALPIDAVLPDLLAALRDGSARAAGCAAGRGQDDAGRAGAARRAVVRRAGAAAGPAPSRRPRAAEFMARERGEEAGATIGYATRLDSRVGKATRVIAMTHGVYLSRLQADPELTGVSAVLFDEVHERSLDSDLALALTLDAADGAPARPAHPAMSATLDSERFARLLGNPPKIESEGKSYPLTLIHEGRDPAQRIEPQMASAIRDALREHDGSLLAFLPGVAEIERTAEALGNLPPNVVLHRLHGGIEPAAAARRARPAQARHAQAGARQRHRRDQPDARRRPRSWSTAASPAARATTAAPASPGWSPSAPAAPPSPSAPAAPRARRPGIAIRLWEEAANASLPAHDPPEILEADLSSLLLTCLLWGESDPDPPPLPRSAARPRPGRGARSG